VQTYHVDLSEKVKAYPTKAKRDIRSSKKSIQKIPVPVNDIEDAQAEQQQSSEASDEAC